MKTDSKLSLFFFLCAVVILVLFFAPVWAGGGDDVELEAELNNSVVHKGGKSIAVGGSDADIAGCRFTEGGLTVQWTRQDKFCQSMKLVEMGYIDAGVLGLCTKTWLKDLYSGLEACQAALVLQYAPVVVEEEENFEEEEYQQMQQEYDERIAKLEQRRPQIIKQTVQQPFLSDETRAKLQAVLDE